MKKILEKLTITEIELSSCFFKKLKRSGKGELKQELDIRDFKYKNNKGEFCLLLKNHFDPRGPFRAQFEFKISFESSEEITQDMLTMDVLKKLITESSRIFSENSFIISFITDRAFGMPLILPPYPIED